MNNDIYVIEAEIKDAEQTFGSALEAFKDTVPQVDRVCPATGRHHRNPCDEFWACWWNDLTAPKWTALKKVAPQVGVLEEQAQAVLAARQALKDFKAAAKAAKAARAAARAEKAAYKAANGARPEEKGPNPYAAGNYDVLTVSLAPAKKEFLARVVPVYVAAAERAFEANKAKQLASKFERARKAAADLVFDRAAATAAAKQSAESEFAGYVAKLSTKIEARVTGAVSLTGSLWNASVLTVATDDGQQVWTTSCKLNARYGAYSANGHYTGYYQWPTHRVS